MNIAHVQFSFQNDFLAEIAITYFLIFMKAFNVLLIVLPKATKSLQITNTFLTIFFKQNLLAIFFNQCSKTCWQNINMPQTEDKLAPSL